MNLIRVLWYKVKLKFNIRSLRQFEATIVRKWQKRIYKEKFSSDDLLNLLISFGVQSGDTLVVHSSWDEFYNFDGTPSELIRVLLNFLGDNGNLVMPSFPIKDIYVEKVFNIRRDPTGAGILAETFRRFPGVSRTIGLHSVCVHGPISGELCKDYEKSHSAWDQYSAYFKLVNYNSKVLCFGLEKHYLPTHYHCVEDYLKDKSKYYSKFFTEKIKVKFITSSESCIENFYYVSNKKFERFTSRASIMKILNNKFDANFYKRSKISNLNVSYFHSKYLFERLIELHFDGITVYKKPKLSKCEI